MEQKRVDLRKAVLRTGRDATVLLAGILAGALAAYGVAAPNDMHHPVQSTQAVMAPGVVTASTAALDNENLRTAASFGHALVALRGAQASPDRSSLDETPAEEGCTTAPALRTYALVDPMLMPKGPAQLAQLARLAQLPSGTATLPLAVPGTAWARDERSTQLLKVGDDFLAQVPWQLALQQVRRGERSWAQVLTSNEPQR